MAVRLISGSNIYGCDEISSCEYVISIILFFLTKRHVNSGQHQLCHDYLKFEPHFTLRICLSVKNVPFTYLNPLSTNRTTRQFADELFECV